MNDEAIEAAVKAVMDRLWPVLGGNHTDAEIWQQVSDEVTAAITSAMPHLQKEYICKCGLRVEPIAAVKLTGSSNG